MDIMKIQDNVQKTAEAIASVIGVDVTVTDQNLRRIAGTGKYKSYIGDKVSDKGVFAYCMKECKAYIVQNPREAKVCKLCNTRETCMEYAEMVCPIQIDQEIYGLIGLIAFDDKQKKLLLKNEKNTLDFLEKMSNLIAAKIIDQKKTQEIKILMSQLQTVINVIDKALIITDYLGQISYYNPKADELFNIRDREINNISKVICDVDLSNLFEKGQKLENKEFEYIKNKSIAKGIINTETFCDQNEIKSVVFLIDELNSLMNFARNIILPSIVTEFDNIIHKSSIMENSIQIAKKASKTNSTVLITGESGTGKELFARAIHYESKRNTEPFIAINCSAIPENLFESELFGYESGAFTGAAKGGHPGKFELSHKGTLLLDEIGDMPLHLQPKLLRVLQDGKVMRIGGKSYIDIDVRIIASTNANLEDKVKNKEFREDLYYRINVIPIVIAPLRERIEDIEILAQHFVNKYAQKLNKEICGISESTMEYLKSYSWKGNVRELENTIEYAVNMTEEKYLTLDIFPPKIRGNTSDVCANNNDEHIFSLEDLERKELMKAISKYGKSNEAVNVICHALGIGRATFYRKIKKYNL